MGQILSLEDFSQGISVGPSTGASETGPEANKGSEKVGFDKGYKAGWDDAIKEATDADTRARASCATALQELDFTYFEAREHVMSSMKPLLDAILAAVLPEAALHGLSPLVQQEVEKLTKSVDTNIEIVCAPDTEAELSGLVNTHSKGPVSVRTENTLTSSQVQLRVDEGITEIDMDRAVATIKDAINTFFAPAQEEMRDYG